MKRAAALSLLAAVAWAGLAACGPAARTPVGIGYTRVLNLTGGMNAWQQAGFPLSPLPAKRRRLRLLRALRLP